MPLRIYVSGALTDIPPRMRERVKKMYVELGDAAVRAARRSGFRGATAYVPHLHGDPILHAHLEPDQILEMDRRKVLASQLLIVVTTYPSYGTGREHEWALAARIPMLAVGSLRRLRSRRISRLARTSEFAAQVYYPSMNAAPSLVERAVSDLLQGRRVKLAAVIKATRKGELQPA